MTSRHTVLLLSLAASAIAPAVRRAEHDAIHAQSSATADATLRLPRIFGSGMVVQRGQPIPVWGWTSPHGEVTVTWRNATRRAIADAAGTWRVTLPATPAGGPHTLAVTSGAARIDLQDVLVGDVWVASGQSNMEFTLSQSTGGGDEAARANDPRIRHFKVPVASAPTPQADLPGGEWHRADTAHAGGFTAVGYHFARRLRESVDVPIGILHSSWGGSAIETWLSRSASGMTDSAWAARQREEETRLEAQRQTLRARIGDLPAADPGLTAGGAPWADPALDDATWAEVDAPAYWEPQGYPGMDGIAWYRLAIELTDAERQGDATLSIAALDDDDVTWINGVEIGRTNGYNVPRRYRIPASALRAGKNVLVVRVSDGAGGGGINGPVTLALRGGVTRSLAGRWKFRVGQVSFAADGQQINKIPMVTYNAMIAPVLPFAVKGVIWYQGESNANDLAQAAAYRVQFRTLVESWRREWRASRQPMPFLWVQLPNYGPLDTVPPRTSTWATQRESMAAALALPATGQAITIDVGEADDIHPRNKRDVGDRLARVALARVYGKAVIASGPTYRAHRARAGRVTVAFDHVAGGLVSREADGRSIRGFAVAGADSAFVRASARIVGDRVEVWSDAVRAPVAVRYAWSNNPVGATLYNGRGLPAAPFRTDRW